MHIPDRDRCNWLRERIETPTLVREACAQAAGPAATTATAAAQQSQQQAQQQPKQQQQQTAPAPTAPAAVAPAAPPSGAILRLHSCDLPGGVARQLLRCLLPCCVHRRSSACRRSFTRWTGWRGVTCLRPSWQTSESHVLLCTSVARPRRAARQAVAGLDVLCWVADDGRGRLAAYAAPCALHWLPSLPGCEVLGASTVTLSPESPVELYLLMRPPSQRPHLHVPHALHCTPPPLPPQQVHGCQALRPGGM